MSAQSETDSLEAILDKNLSGRERDEVYRIMYGGYVPWVDRNSSPSAK